VIDMKMIALAIIAFIAGFLLTWLGTIDEKW